IIARISVPQSDRQLSQRLDVEVAELDTAIVTLHSHVSLLAQQARMLFDVILVVIEVRIGDYLSIQFDRNLAAFRNNAYLVPLAGAFAGKFRWRDHAVNRSGVLRRF